MNYKVQMMYKIIVLLVIALSMFETFTYARPEDQGKFVLDVNRERGEGTKVDARARHEVWRSDDGRSKVEAYGHWDRTYGGRNDGQRSHGGGARFEHSWGK